MCLWGNFSLFERCVTLLTEHDFQQKRVTCSYMACDIQTYSKLCYTLQHIVKLRGLLREVGFNLASHKLARFPPPIWG